MSVIPLSGPSFLSASFLSCSICIDTIWKRLAGGYHEPALHCLGIPHHIWYTFPEIGCKLGFSWSDWPLAVITNYISCSWGGTPLVNERSLHMAELQTLMTGLAFGESPRWHNERLWFSDFGAQEVVAVDLEGKSEVIARIAGTPMGLGFLPDGRLLIVSMRDGLLLRR